MPAPTAAPHPPSTMDSSRTRSRARWRDWISPGACHSVLWLELICVPDCIGCVGGPDGPTPVGCVGWLNSCMNASPSTSDSEELELPILIALLTTTTPFEVSSSL